MTDAIKYDDKKPRYDLIPGGALDELARVYTMGAKKYADNNWRNGMRWGRVFAAIMRHLWAFWRGEDRDIESGLPHLAHAAWGCFTLIEYWLEVNGEDDRGNVAGITPPGQVLAGLTAKTTCTLCGEHGIHAHEIKDLPVTYADLIEPSLDKMQKLANTPPCNKCGASARLYCKCIK